MSHHKKAGPTQFADGFLFTDHYELTMAQLYFRAGIHERQAQFDHFFRKYPDYGSHTAGYCISAGLAWLLDFLQCTRIQSREIEALRGMEGQAGQQVFGDDFLDWLAENGHYDSLTVEAAPEGRVVHANAPFTVVRGPLAIAQILESALLNIVNYQTLIATKACRLRHSGRGQLTIDFGMRRAQGLGANAGARAALIGGADFTSNTGISFDLGYPPKGTHAHSMVQAFMALGGGELEAFRQYAEVYPDQCVLLVDTVDTLESGIPNAIRVFEDLRKKGHQPVGVRLDSGDLAYLAVRAAKMLDDAGFEECSIVLSNQLDEVVIQQILTQISKDAPKQGLDPDNVIGRLAYGVGTRLITSMGAPALDGVYKLVGIKKDNQWQPAIKLSETPAKTINPGSKAVWRLYDQRQMATADLICLDDEDPNDMQTVVLRHPVDASSTRRLAKDRIADMEPILETVFEHGHVVGDLPDIEAMRQRRIDDLDRLDEGVKRIISPHRYHVSLSEKLWDLKQDLIGQKAAQNGQGDH